MAIIRYQLESGRVPSYITDGGYFYNPSADTLIGIGSGGGTELTQAELLEYIKAIGGKTYDYVDMTDAHCEAAMNDWLSNKGIS